jgi:flagellar motor switch protein FliN/FliY
VSDPTNPTEDPTKDPTENAPEAILDEQFEAQGDSAEAPDAGNGNGIGAGNGAGSNGAAGGQDADLRRLADVPMELSVEIGRTQITVGETLALRAGSVVTLDRLAGEPVDLLVNGTQIARGEVVVVDEQFGMRVTQIVDGEHTPSTPAQAPEQDAPDGDEALEP